MTSSHKGMIVLMVAAAGLWGCSQGEQKTSGHDKRIKALEAKCGELESSCLTLKQTHEEEKAKLESEKADLQKQIDVHKMIAKERDALKVMVNARTNERDTYHGQLEELRKGIRTLLTRVEASLPACDDATTQKTSTVPRY